MKQVNVITISETVQALERSYLEFNYYNPPNVLTDVVNERVVIDADRKLAPVHRICESGKPDIYLAIEPKLYDIVTDIKINDLQSSLESERAHRKQLEENRDRLKKGWSDVCHLLSIERDRIGYFNDLPWWKRIFKKV